MSKVKNNDAPNCTSYNPGDFSRAVARIATAQICESLGYLRFQNSALDTLSDVAVRYITEIGRIASLRAETSNRSESNVFDVIQGLEDLGSIQGFSSASKNSRPLSKSGVVRDVMRYVWEAEEIPFAYLVPRFPIVKEKERERERNTSFPAKGYVPRWLPKFPDYETYAELGSEKRKDWGYVVEEKIQRVNRKRGGTEINPYLATPLRNGDMEVDVPGTPVKLTGHPQNCEITENCVSALESLLLVNETEDRRKMVRNGRPNVRFKFRNGKKSLGKSRRSRIGGFEKSSVWFADGNGGREEMKRKAEQNFRGKVECLQDTTHLYISDLGLKETVIA